MGTWGPGLYQNDLAADIRDTFKDQLKRGKIGKQITKELLAEYECPFNWSIAAGDR